MFDTPSGPSGRIGPNAVLQLLPVLEAAGGAGLRDEMLAASGLGGAPSDSGLMDEAPAGTMHRALRRRLPDTAPGLLREAGCRTGAYILAHRIPPLAQKVLKALPAALSGPMLAKAIARHSWTFAGSGTFRVVSTRPMVFELTDNPLIRGESAPAPLCIWHEAVFDTLFRTLVDKRLSTRETACAASGATVCRFEIVRH
ncbi:divinyl protochlorophyllide a 8-vinyl-reductase [Rhodovulum imhoffii]|uniref:Divinyl protochlorophyllide a 8-vinyl-reductase n=1 Tax=Rhodovulum imhoffii TaxID=365340 RepID=A0A2T5BT19_9RHOB|nr:bacteriochlorophyll 4-vinyl reductase [Rhodovulum imhoffii]MBK5933813.1 bacteriochlorophyll 4-vinyl reductase [Rhodovulum imhoffii]PTN02542.1 divinyl protochlorophyllide a 8-vinyl-reductase [Rhodovulum imhoffii]